MKRKGKIFAILVCVILIVAAFVFVNDYWSTPAEDNEPEMVVNNEEMTTAETSETVSLDHINKLTIDFTENLGQIQNDDIRFYCRGKGVWFLRNGIVFDIVEPEDESDIIEEPNFNPEIQEQKDEPINRKGVMLKLNFQGCNLVTPMGNNMQQHKSNYFYGDNPSKWLTDIPTYKEIVYPNIYNNIDLLFQNTNNGLKYNFIIHPRITFRL